MQRDKESLLTPWLEVGRLEAGAARNTDRDEDMSSVSRWGMGSPVVTAVAPTVKQYRWTRVPLCVDSAAR